MFSSGLHCLPGHIISRGILSSRAHYLRDGLSRSHCLGGILFRGRLSLGRVVSRAVFLRGTYSPGHIVSQGGLSPGHIISERIVLGHIVSGHIASGHLLLFLCANFGRKFFRIILSSQKDFFLHLCGRKGDNSKVYHVCYWKSSLRKVMFIQLTSCMSMTMTNRTVLLLTKYILAVGILWMNC